MKFIVTVVALFAIVALTKAGYVESLTQLHRSRAEITVDNGNDVKTNWVTQPLDHFNKRNKRTWLMRYMVNEEHFEIGGPMFVFVGGCTPILASLIQSGIFYDLAKEHKGILFFTEHRYYGGSKPTSTLSTEMLKYLHSKQVLADLAMFIRTKRKDDFRLTSSKVIMAGSSYAGSLVIWFSKLYPELVNGGWASSAPILAQVDFKEYNEISGKAYRELGSQQCYNRIQNGIAELEAMFADDRWAEAKAMLLLCNSFDHNDELDLWSLFHTVVSSFTKTVVYQTGVDIYSACTYLMSFEDDLTAVIAVFLVNNFFGQNCIDVSYKNLYDTFTDLSQGRGNPRPWFYQLCNEFGWFRSTSSKKQPFGTKVPAALHTTLCYNLFGPNYTYYQIHDLIAETNKLYSGKNPDVKNVYVTYGALDPWSPLGLNKTHGASVIPLNSHCSDLNSISDSDSAEMRASKQRLVELVRTWLA